MSWIKTINYEAADSKLKRIYDRVKGPNNNIDNVLLIHSLRPHSLVGHMTLYKNVLHNSNNTLPKWYLEAIGVFVSYLNDCEYCVEHHLAGYSRLLNDELKATEYRQAIVNSNLESYFGEQYYAGILYAKKLTQDIERMNKQDIDALRAVGFTDGEILEINQVTSYFNYVNRTVRGLGVDIKGDIIGLSPNNSDDPNSWGHQ